MNWSARVAGSWLFAGKIQNCERKFVKRQQEDLILMIVSSLNGKNECLCQEKGHWNDNSKGIIRSGASKDIIVAETKGQTGTTAQCKFFFPSKFVLIWSESFDFNLKKDFWYYKKILSYAYQKKKDESNWNLKFLFYCLVLLHFPKCVLPVQTLIDILYRNKRWFPFSKFDFCAGTKVYEDALNMIKFLDLHNEK